jgi:hypothetical protein
MIEIRKNIGKLQLFCTLLYTKEREIEIIKKLNPQQLDTFHLFSRHFLKPQSTCFHTYTLATIEHRNGEGTGIKSQSTTFQQ